MDDVIIGVSDCPQFTRFYRVTASVDGKTVGYAYGYVLGDAVHLGRDKYRFSIQDVYVDPSMRGKGIGRKLMSRLIEIARKELCKRVVLDSHSRRKAARALYTSMGFKPHGREFRLDL